MYTYTLRKHVYSRLKNDSRATRATHCERKTEDLKRLTVAIQQKYLRLGYSTGVRMGTDSSTKNGTVPKIERWRDQVRRVPTTRGKTKKKKI